MIENLKDEIEVKIIINKNYLKQNNLMKYRRKNRKVKKIAGEWKRKLKTLW